MERRALIGILLVGLMLGTVLPISSIEKDDQLKMPDMLPDRSKLQSVKDLFIEVMTEESIQRLRAYFPHVTDGKEYYYALYIDSHAQSEWGILVLSFGSEETALDDFQYFANKHAFANKTPKFIGIPGATAVPEIKKFFELTIQNACIMDEIIVFVLDRYVIWVDDYQLSVSVNKNIVWDKKYRASLSRAIKIAESIYSAGLRTTPSISAQARVCQEWYKLSFNGQLYTINIIAETPISGLDQLPLSQSDPIKGIYVTDAGGNIVTDISLVETLIIAAQNEAIFVGRISPSHFNFPISSNDLYTDMRTDKRGNAYLIIGPNLTAEWWRDLWIYTDTLFIKGLDTYEHRVDIWTDVLLNSVLQPDLYDSPESDPRLGQDLKDLNRYLKAAGLHSEISSKILEGKNAVILHPKPIQATLNNYKRISANIKLASQLGQLAAVFDGISTALEIDAEATQMMLLHTLANARAEERLAALGEFIEANHDVLDPALVEAYHNNVKNKFHKVQAEYYNKLRNLLISASHTHTLVSIGFAMANLVAAFKSSALAKVLLPYYVSWEAYKGLQEETYKVQRLSLAATLQRYLADQHSAHGLGIFQQYLQSRYPNTKNEIEIALNLYNINHYLGLYFYRNLYDVFNGNIFGKVSNFFTGGRFSDYLEYLYEQASTDETNAIQTRSPSFLTDWTWGGWMDYYWLIGRVVDTHFHIIANSENEQYEREQTARVNIEISNNLCRRIQLWIDASFRAPTEVKFTPQKVSPDPNGIWLAGGEEGTFVVEWKIPSNAPIGQYRIAVDAWADSMHKDKYDDDLEWRNIFNIVESEKMLRINIMISKSSYIVGERATVVMSFNKPVTATLVDHLPNGIAKVVFKDRQYNAGSHSFKAQVTSEGGLGQETLELIAYDGQGNRATDSVTFSVQKKPSPKPEMLASSTVLVIDVSSSMEWQDPTGKIKIEAAKDAARRFIDMFAHENKRTGASHQLAVVTFSSSASLQLHLTSDADQARRIVFQLRAGGGTNMAQGLSLANTVLKGADPESKRIIILLSDGVPTISMSGKSSKDPEELKREVLLGPVAEAALNGYCIYVVGFGKPGEKRDGWLSIDSTFLSSIALSTGCGPLRYTYYTAANADQLTKIYIRLRHGSLGRFLKEFSGRVSEGETVSIGKITVPPDQKELHFTLSWPGSRLDPILIDPNGQEVDNNYPGASIAIYPNLIHVIVLDPLPGDWYAEVFGSEVPEGGIDFDAVFSTRSRPESDLADLIKRLALLLLILIIATLLSSP